jgi:hypothetical protein
MRTSSESSSRGPWGCTVPVRRSRSRQAFLANSPVSKTQVIWQLESSHYSSGETREREPSGMAKTEARHDVTRIHFP